MSEPSELQLSCWRAWGLVARYKREAKKEKTRAALWEGKASIMRHENNALRRKLTALKIKE